MKPLQKPRTYPGAKAPGAHLPKPVLLDFHDPRVTRGKSQTDSLIASLAVGIAIHETSAKT